MLITVAFNLCVFCFLYCSDIIPWLVEKFEYAALLQNMGSDDIEWRYALNGDDVHDVFMLPRNPRVEVPYVFQYRGTDSSIGVMREQWKSEFPDNTTRLRRLIVMFCNSLRNGLH